MSTHLDIASREGAKAGFDFYMAQNVPTARERQERIRRSQDPLTAYCREFPDHFGPLSPEGVRVQDERTDDERQGLIERLLKRGYRVLNPEPESDDDLLAEAQAAGLTVETGDGVQVFAPVEPKARKANASKASNKTTPLLKKGDTFVYSGKTQESEWTVLRTKGGRYIATNGRRESGWKIAWVDKQIAAGGPKVKRA
jgi:hypothetical protein